MPSERSEHRETQHALARVFDYISPGTNEGISFSLAQLTDDLSTDSFLAGGDISLFTPSGHRGKSEASAPKDQCLHRAAARRPSSQSISRSISRLGPELGVGRCPTERHRRPPSTLQHVKTANRPEGLMASVLAAPPLWPRELASRPLA